MDVLVFTDLDGTLLTHNDYSFHEADDTLTYIKSQKIPLIIATSKTYSEVVHLQEKLQIQSPFIVENGAGIFIPSDSILATNITADESYIKISQAQSYLELRLFFKQLQHRYAIKGFGDMTTEEVMELTSLDEGSAQNAMKRDFTEPFILEGEVDILALAKEVYDEGLDVVKGGRFYHLISKNQDKARAMKHLTHLFEEHFCRRFKMIALGDSANDFTMLKEADIGILIPQVDGTYAAINDESVRRAPFAGPKGWNAMLQEILDV